MNLHKQRRIYFATFLIIISLVLTACDDEFYLSEKEVAAFTSTLETHGDAHQFYGGLKGKTITLEFDNSSGTPKLQSTNLVDVMRQTQLATLENGNAAVSLVRLEEELKKQIGNWVEGRLDLYVDEDDDKSRLEALENISVYFVTNPEFIYNADKQSISFDVRLRLTMNGTIKIKALNWLFNLFANVNGTYPMTIKMDDLQLKGEANVFSPYVNGGRTRFQLTPKILSPIRVLQNGSTSIPNQVKDGAEQLLTYNLSQYVDEVFHQDYDYFALSDIKLTNENPNRLEVKYRAKSKELKTDSAKPQMHIVAFAADGKLYHSQKFKGDWSKYKEIEVPNQPTLIHNNPTLFHSGGNQLELAAVDNSGNLIYAHFRDEEWGNFKVNPYGSEVRYRGKPTVVASAPGQAEIVVEGDDGSLFHLRRKNGVWLSSKRIPIHFYQDIAPAPYRKPVAVHVGNKIVVVFIDGENLPKAIDFDLETENWGQVIEVSNQVQTPYAPAAIASGENRIDTAYVGQDGQVYHQILRVKSDNILPNSSPPQTVILDGNENTVSGVQSYTTPVLTASTYNQPELVVLGDSNKIYQTHFFNSLISKTIDGQTIQPGWQDWEILEGNFFSDKLQINGRVSEFDAVSTNSGRVEVVARNMASHWSDQKSIFHNSLESGRFSHVPWKTLNWRGWEQTQTNKFLGRPAIAVADSNFNIGFVGKKGGAVLHTGNLAKLNITEFDEYSFLLKSTGDVIDPILLSTAPGMSDSIALKKDGKILHVRYFGNKKIHPRTISHPISLTGISAVSYGKDYIELVGTGANRKVYHWRFRDGNWSGGNVIADGVISEPIIKHIGAGQLELMGIDFDQQLKRWRFYDNQWHNKLSVPQTIRINEKTFGSASAASWGDGTIDLVVVDKDTQKLHHRRIGPGDEICNQPIGCPTPRQFMYMNDKSFEKPVLSAFSPTRLNVLSMKGLRWYSSWSSLFYTPLQYPDPPIKWESFKDIGGSEMVIGSVAHAGRYNLSAIATASGKIYVNRNRNRNWSGFRKVYGQTEDQTLRNPIFLPTISSFGN